jgi:POT family proton-dependent oligopeptide transporter
MSTIDTAATGEDRAFLGHPRGLATLFFTEMWERFSFYGMRALLVIYLTQHFLFSDDRAQGLYGAYAALVYLMPVLGGFLADRFLGARKAVTIGATLLVLGHFGMAFEGSGSKQYLDVAGQSYVIAPEGRSEARELFIDLPEGRQSLRFESIVQAEAVPLVTGAPRAFAAGAYSVESEPPTFLYRLCGMIGLVCGEAPAATLVVDGQRYPIRAEDGRNVVDLPDGAYAFAERTERNVVAYDPGPTDAAEDDRVVQTFEDGTYTTRVVEEPFYVQILYVSLAFIIMGVGFLKANISTTVGALYAPGDPRRDGGFTIFYMGINLGSVLATAACGYLGVVYGWKFGFGLAGLGMLAGLIQYLTSQRHLMGKAEPPKPLGKLAEGGFWILALLLVIPSWFLVQQTELMEQALPIGVPILFFAVLGLATFGFKGAERSKMIAALILIMFSVVFWMLFEQAGSSLSLYAARSTDLTVATPGSIGHGITTGLLGLVALASVVGGIWCVVLFLQRKIDAVLLGYGIFFAIVLGLVSGWIFFTTGLGSQTFALTAPQTQLFNPAFIVLLAIPMSALWTWLGKRRAEPSTPVKFALALIQVGLGFFVLVLGVSYAEDYKVPLTFLALLYLLHTTGELFLSPVGLSMITKLSAARVVGLMMGVWFLSSSLAHILAAIIAQRTGSETVAGEVVDPAGQLQTYVTEFTVVGIYGIVAGVLLLAVTPWLKRAMGDVR